MTKVTGQSDGTERNAPSSAVTRRHLLRWIAGSVGVVVVAGATGLELVSHGILPGGQLLDEIDGACSLPAPRLSFDAVGPSESGSFYSSARQRHVGYMIAYPPAHRLGDSLPLIVMLHGYGQNHANALVGMTSAQALALRVNGEALTPMAMVTVDGGNGYWNPHPGVEQLVRALRSRSTEVFSAGCHTDSFFLEQEPPSIAFHSHHLR